MSNDWIVDVLTDLRAFAQANGLPKLTGSLEAAAGVALLEIAGNKGTGPVTGHVDGDGHFVGRDTGRANAR